MWMTDWEITKSYRTAANKNKQIRILSELNACDVVSIIQALNRQGVRLDKKRPPQPRKVKGLGRPKCDIEIREKPQEYKDAMMVLLSKHKQHDLARITGISDALVSAYVLGQKRPSKQTFEKILKGLNITREEFFQMGKEVRW